MAVNGNEKVDSARARAEMSVLPLQVTGFAGLTTIMYEECVWNTSMLFVKS